MAEKVHASRWSRNGCRSVCRSGLRSCSRSRCHASSGICIFLHSTSMSLGLSVFLSLPLAIAPHYPTSSTPLLLPLHLPSARPSVLCPAANVLFAVSLRFLDFWLVLLPFKPRGNATFCCCCTPLTTPRAPLSVSAAHQRLLQSSLSLSQ